MSNLFALLVPTTNDASYAAYRLTSFILIALMGIAAIVAIILVLMQPANSTGIDALGGSGETVFGKNKGTHCVPSFLQSLMLIRRQADFAARISALTVLRCLQRRRVLWCRRP